MAKKELTAVMGDLIRKARETYTQPLYDSADLTNGLATPVNLFTDITNKNALQTSMLANAILTNPRQFLVQEITFNPVANITLADLQAIIGGMYMQFFIGDKEYLTCPLFMAPGGTGMSGVVATTAASSFQAVNNGWAHPTARLRLKAPGQLIQSQENFRVTLTPPAAITLAATRRVWVFLWGLQLRAVQ